MVQTMKAIGTSLQKARDATRDHLSYYWPLYTVMGAGAVAGAAAAFFGTQEETNKVLRGITVGASAAAGVVAVPAGLLGIVPAVEKADQAFFAHEHRLPNWVFPKARARKLVREADQRAALRHPADARRYAERALELYKNVDSYMVLGDLSGMEAQERRDAGDVSGYRASLKKMIRLYDVSQQGGMQVATLLADTPDRSYKEWRAAQERLEAEEKRHNTALQWRAKFTEATNAYEERGDKRQLAAALDALFCFSRYAAQEEIDELGRMAGIAPHLSFAVKVGEQSYLHPTRHVYERLQRALLMKYSELLGGADWYWNEKPSETALAVAGSDLGSVGDGEERADHILAGSLFGRAYAATGDERYLQDAWQRIHRASRPQGRFERDQPYRSAVQHAASVRSWLANLYREKSERAEALADAKKPWDGSHPGERALRAAAERAEREKSEEAAWWAGALNARAYAALGSEDYRTAALAYAQQFAGRSATINGKPRRFDDLARWLDSLQRKHIDGRLADVEMMLSRWDGTHPAETLLRLADEAALYDKRTPAQLAAAVAHTRAYAAGGPPYQATDARFYLAACTEPGAALYGKRITVSGMQHWLDKIDAGRRA